jgi:predicted dehydrogenase
MSYQRDYPQRVRVGIVGVGGHCYRNILPALHFLPVQLVGVCDVKPDLARATAAQFGCRAFTDAQEMFTSGEIEATLLVVGPTEHPRLATEAFDAGLHVWMEKPAAMRAREVEAMIARRGDRVGVVGFKKVFMPSARKALELVRAPGHGPLRTMLAVYPMDLPSDGAAVLEQRRFTNWLGNGCHPLSLLIAAGGTPQEVISHRGGHGGGACIIHFTGGAQATFHLASGPWPNERYAFFSERLHVEIDNSLRVTLHRFIPFDYGRTTDYAPPGEDHGTVVWEPQNTLSTLENHSLVTQGIWDELMYFCRCVLEKRPAQTGSLELALDVMRVYEAALISEGSPVKLPGSASRPSTAAGATLTPRK